PNGRRIAYIAYNSDIAYNSGAGRLFVMKADGSSKRQLAASAGECCYASSPTWSPDGRQIAYSRGGVIYTVHADGSAQRPLTPGSSFDCAAGSPNGRGIAFEGPPRYTSIYVATSRGRLVAQRRVTRHAYTEGGGFAWSPDSRRIVYARENAGGVYMINVNGTHDRRLTSNPM